MRGKDANVFVSFAQHISEIIGVLIFLFGCFIMAAWKLNPAIVKFLSPDQIITKFNVAGCFSLIGIALWCFQAKRMTNAKIRLIGIYSSVALMLIGVLTFSEYVFQFNLGIDQLFLKVPLDYLGDSIPGRMSFNTSICFILISCSLLLSSRKTSSMVYVIHSLAIIVGYFSIVCLISFLYGAKPFYIGPHFSKAMTLISSILFPLSSIGILFLQPDKGLTAQTTFELMGGKILRFLLPMAIFTPVLMGYLQLYAQREWHSGNELGVMFVALGNFSIFTISIYLLSVLLNLSDIKRRKLEKETIEAHGELLQHKIHLEDIVKERTMLLEESEKRVRKQLSSTTDYIYTVQIENGRAVETTHGPLCWAVTGYSREDYKADPLLWLNMIYIDDRPKVLEITQHVLNGTSVEPYEHRIYHKDGTIRWLHNTIVSRQNNEGVLIAYDGLVSDITERKRQEEMLREAKDTAEKALAVKDEFTSTVSHELRTPLAAIKSSIDILATEVPGSLSQDQKVFIQRVKSNIDRLARLINDVLDLSKLESGKMMMNFVPLHPEAVVQEVVDSQLTFIQSKGLKITTEFGKEIPMLVADKDRLIQVLNNLINNACKFTKEGSIVVAVHSEDNHSVTFSVRDTGMGIKEEDLSKLFKKFQQVGSSSHQVSGTGLGLAISKMIVAKHNGRIWVESQFGHGSSFNFNIPVRKTKRILCVDDDSLTIEILRTILEAENSYELEVAADGFMAGQKYYDFNPHLIILDINIPKINGLDVCSRIKGDPKTKNIKVIMISSFDSQEKKASAWDAGADEIINKPINSEELIAKVRKLI